MFPKAFTELALGLSDLLKVTSFSLYQVYEVFEWRDMESVIFRAPLVVKKEYSLFDPLGEKNR